MRLKLQWIVDLDQSCQTCNMNLPNGSRLLGQFTFTDLHQASYIYHHIK